MIFWQLLFLFLSVKGFLLLKDYLLQIPPPKTKQMLLVTTKKKRFIKQILLDEIIEPFVKILVPLIRIPDEHRRIIHKNLERADIKETPEQYYARAVVTAVFMAILPLLCYLAGVKTLMLASFILIPLTFYSGITKHKAALTKKRTNIELGLPGFIRAILYKMNDSGSGIVKTDLISIFEDYLQVANPVFAYDVSILITEMKSRDLEMALRNFANRVNIAEVSFLCNALIGVTRGEAQKDTLASLAHDMDIKSKENIRKELAKRPGKVSHACIPLVVITMCSLLYVLLQNLIGGVGAIL